MRCSFNFNRCFLGLVLVLLAPGQLWANSAASNIAPQRISVPQSVQSAWQDMDHWLARSPSGKDWRKFLKASELGQVIQGRSELELESLARTLQRLQSGAPGLAEPRFQALEKALAEWLPKAAAQTARPLAAHWTSEPRDIVAATEQEQTWLREAALRAHMQLDAYLQRNPHREAWRKFLSWEQVHAQLSGQQPADVRLLGVIADRLTAGHDARRIPAFVRFGEALSRYEAALRIAADEDPAQAFRDRMVQLRQRLAQYEREPNYENLEALAAAMGELESRGQAAGTLVGLRHHLFKPNLYFAASAPLVTYGTGQQVDRPSPVAECIDGTWVQGQGRTRGDVHGALGTSDQYALLLNHFQGQTYSNTLGFNSGATISSSGVTRFQAIKGVTFDGHQFLELPVQAHARTSTQTRWVDSGRDCFPALADRIAWNRVQQRKGRSEYFASRSAERKIERQFNEGVTEAVIRSERNYRDKILHWMLNQQIFPEDMRWSSDPNGVYVTASQRRVGQAGSPHDAPPAPQGAAMSVRVHESAVNNSAAAGLTDLGLLERAEAGPVADPRVGRTLQRDEVRAAIRERFPNAKLQPVDPREKPWEITFASREPLRVRFDRQRVTITLRVRRFAAENATPDLPDGDLMVEAVYRIERGPDGPVAVLEDQPLVWYSAPGQTKYREYLGIWLGLGAWDWGTPGEILGALEELEFQLDDKQVFPERIEGLIKLGGKWEGYGNLRPETMLAENGWLTVGWKRVPKTDEDSKIEVIASPK